MTSYNTPDKKRLTLATVINTFKEKGYSFAKVGKSYLCQSTNQKFTRLPEALEYLQTLPDNKIVETVVEPLTFTTIPTPEQFFSEVVKLESVLEVHQACNALMDKLAENFTVATVSKKLSAYKKLFYNFQHDNPKLNKTVETKDGQKVQHIAGTLLQLSDEQKQFLGVDREKRSNSRAGFNDEGDLREVETPLVDITAIVEKSLECLASVDPYVIGCGIINLTGLRANEQNMPIRKYQWGLVERDMVVVDEYKIAFKGISKKSNSEDTLAYHSRVTLVPAQIIVDAQERFNSTKAVQSISSDYEKYRKGFMDTFSNRYQELFSRDLSTIEAYDDNGSLVAANGTPHKGRAFYACALRATLRAKNFPNSASNKYIQLCLAHENEGITIKYLGRYDESDFINPVEINIPTNIKELGKMISTVEKAIPVVAETHNKPQTVVKTPEVSFDIDAFVDSLDPDMQVRFSVLINDGLSITNALIALFKQNTMTKTNLKKKNVSDEIAEIGNAIMIYNNEQSSPTSRIVPTYSAINKISERLFNKTMAKTTIDQWLSANSDTLHEQLENLDIPGGLYNSQWNQKYHRKTMDIVIDNIITIFNRE